MIVNFKSYYPEGIMKFIPQDILDAPGEINIYADNFTMMNELGKNSIALLVEPRSIIPSVYEYIEKHYDRFKYVFTFDSKLLGLPNAKLFIYGQVQEVFDEEKTKLISMACSDKDFCEGHRLRKEIAWKLKGKIDTYGRFDGGEFASYHDIYAQYKFNVAIENYQDGYYFTEKLCNCFANRIIPIYYGCPNIKEFFNVKGIFIVHDPEKISKMIDVILEHGDYIYEQLKDYIEDNYNRVQKYSRFGVTFFRMYGDLIKEIAL